MNKYIYILDERPMEMLTPEERQAKFDEQIGPYLNELTDEEVAILRKAYMLDED